MAVAASAMVLERVGMLFEGHTKSSFWLGDDNSDDWIYGMTRGAWEVWRDRPRQRPVIVRLVEIDADSMSDVRRLTTHKSQERFVSPVASSYGDALLPEVIDGAPVVPWMRAIEADGELVGFMMVALTTDAHPEPYLWRLLIDRLHQRGVGVILDWVPSHFPNDTHGLYEFDGTHLFEHADPRQGYHPDWNSAIFNYSRNEVRSFLVSSAMCWLDRYHVDGIRVDAVASMLYLDYSREQGEWIPNEFGGRENLDAIVFLRQLNEAVYGEFPDVATMAEESTSWPMVSQPTYVGGLGFGFKWDMGWMHDTLAYFEHDPIHRRWHHGEITFRSVYASSEHFVLPLSHDEVVYGKGSLLSKMPGDPWQQFANLRLLYAMQWAQPGKKLLFMGCELATRAEWNHEGTLDWSLHDADGHRGVREWLADINRLYAREPALHRGDSDPDGMQWVESADADQSVYAWLRRDPTGAARLAVFNATPTPRYDYRLGVPAAGSWAELANSDAEGYGGSGVGNYGGVDTVSVDSHGFHQSVVLTLPPLGAVFLAPEF